MDKREDWIEGIDRMKIGRKVYSKIKVEGSCKLIWIERDILRTLLFRCLTYCSNGQTED